jgi:UPF0755 protein
MLKLIGWCFTLLVIAVAAIAVYGAYEATAPNQLTEPKLVVVPRGSGVRTVAAQLETDKVINNQWVFVAAAVARREHTKIKAGEYEFTPGMDMRAVLVKLAKGETYHRAITIREGLTSYQVVEILKGVGTLGGELTQVPPEGSLLPETYQFSAGDTKQDIINRMTRDMTATIDKFWPDRAAGLPLTTPAEAITLASIVEKETGVSEERRRVAGVFINRLKQGMKLQTDPTVIYALTMGKHQDAGQGPLGRRLLRKDLEQTDSPYNTYMYEGLPPGPIANPGKASIDAVLHPETHDFLFFVADGKGGHIFAKTAREHEQNVADWRKIRAAAQ